MRLRVELHGFLDQYSPDDSNAPFSFEIAEGATVEELMRKLHIPEEMAAVIVVGDEAREPSQVLAEGDHVTLVPPMGGG
jgi:sulfur carrier protein ThiS